MKTIQIEGVAYRVSQATYIDVQTRVRADPDHQVLPNAGYIEPILDKPRGYNFIPCWIRSHDRHDWLPALLVATRPMPASRPYGIYRNGDYGASRFCKIEFETDLQGADTKEFHSYNEHRQMEMIRECRF